MIIALFAATVLMAETASALQAQPAAPAAAAAAPAPEKPKKVEASFACRREASVGTRLPTRRCRSSAEIAEQQRSERATLEKAQVATSETSH